MHCKARRPQLNCRWHPFQPCCSFYDARPDVAPPGNLASRVLLLTRVPASAAAGDGAASVSSGSGSSSAQEDERWQAGWASGGQLAGWVIRSSRGALYDHQISRLLGVLRDLSAPAAADDGASAADASGEDSRQPLALHVHKHSE